MIVEWILILTMVSSESNVIREIPGFTTQETCVAAGKTWFDKTYPKFDKWHWGVVTPSYICVRK